MLGIEDYGSDDDSVRSGSPPVQPAAKEIHVKSLPKASTSKPQRAPKKITIALPSISASKDASEEETEKDRPAKKRKVGAGASSLLSMLPTPKESNPTPPVQRVLGGGSGRGLDFKTHTSHDYSDTPVISFSEETAYQDEEPANSAGESAQPVPSTLFRPTSLAKGKSNISIEESNVNRPSLSSRPSTSQVAAPSRPVAPTAPAADFFSFSSLGSSSSSNTPSSSGLGTKPLTSLTGTFSAAPELPTFEPPEPLPTDPYPGYYQLPSGAWAAYDAEYYGKFMKKWEKEYNAHVRALEKGTIKGFEGLQNADVEEIDALKEMEKAKKEIRDREERKAVTQGAAGGPVAPKMNINASKLSGVARSRHQLSTLLKEAYENREALEERIAQGKRNRKEAGNKYGF